ncbi:hypothetical protein AG1IA_05062 [Rhizoctonia solani AG-1 IA]|uniref:DUF1746 domain-containing protein n=1 Tax=Thanatephorus cucumeris (strain AG1-IA) TaxID=983506 RepID=L8WSG6_THACA|nr:hypothetical protein AG1IA_05062 [Rhizoctonia solani AG-1 IA]
MHRHIRVTRKRRGQYSHVLPRSAQSPSPVRKPLTALIARLVAQYRITVLRDVQPTYPLRFHVIILLLITAGPLLRHIFGGIAQGSGVLLDFVGQDILSKGVPTHSAHTLAIDLLLLLFQIVQLTISYETARWKPEVPDPLFTPPLPVPSLQATTTPKPRSRRSERSKLSIVTMCGLLTFHCLGSRQSQLRTTRAGYRDVIENRTRHVHTSTASFPPTTAVIDLPLRTLVRLLFQSEPSDEASELPGPVTDGRRRIGLAAQLVVMLLRMRAARQGGGEGQGQQQS